MLFQHHHVQPVGQRFLLDIHHRRPNIFRLFPALRRPGRPTPAGPQAQQSSSKFSCLPFAFRGSFTRREFPKKNNLIVTRFAQLRPFRSPSRHRRSGHSQNRLLTTLHTQRSVALTIVSPHPTSKVPVYRTHAAPTTTERARNSHTDLDDTQPKRFQMPAMAFTMADRQESIVPALAPRHILYLHLRGLAFAPEVIDHGTHSQPSGRRGDRDCRLRVLSSRPAVPRFPSPHSAPNAAGAQNDILAIAQAERAYQAENGSYAPLDKLLSSGALSMQKPARDGYEYNVEPSSTNFRVVARCTGAESGCTSFFVDSTMSVQPLQ